MPPTAVSNRSGATCSTACRTSAPVADGREEKIRRILRDDGATYNLYGQDDSPGNAWGTGRSALHRGSEDWARIEAGLLERAELFNLILRDFYGAAHTAAPRRAAAEALFSTAASCAPARAAYSCRVSTN